MAISEKVCLLFLIISSALFIVDSFLAFASFSYFADLFVMVVAGLCFVAFGEK